MVRKNNEASGRHLLISPNQTLFSRRHNRSWLKVSKGSVPLDLGYCGTDLQKKGYEVKLVLANRYDLSLEEVEDEIRKFNPDTIGISSASGYVCPGGLIEPTLRVLGLLREKFPHLRTIAFGGNAHYFTEKLLDVGADVLIRKEPELKYAEIMDNISNLSSVNGISFKQDGEIIHNPDDQELPNLNEMGPINYHLFKEDVLRIELNPMTYDYAIPSKKLVTLETSRGCPYLCIFCNMRYHRGKLVRFKDIDKVIEEIKYYKSEFGIDAFYIPDNTFTINRQHTMDICERISELPYKIYWRAVTRPDYIDTDLLKKMKAAGCYQISFGLETADDKMLKKAKKKFTAKDVESAVKMCKQAGIKTSLFSIFFLPGETMENINHTLRFMAALKPLWIGANIATPSPYTDLYKMGQAEGKLTGERLLEECIEYAGSIGTDFEPTEVKRIYNKIRKQIMLINLTSDPLSILRYLFNVLINPRDFISFVSNYLKT